MQTKQARTETSFRQYLLSSGRLPNTAQTYVSNLAMFWRACSAFEVTPYDADRRLVRQWISGRLEEGVSSARVYNDLAALRQFYAWLREDDYRDDDPTEGVKIKRTKSLPTRPLAADELTDMLLRGCREERDRLLVVWATATGMRVSELAEMVAEDVDWRAGEITVHGKGDKERAIPVPPLVLERLRLFLGLMPCGPVWLSLRRRRPMSGHQIRKVLYAIAERAGVREVHPHRMRSTFATAYLDQHADIQALQSVMGHSSIETTARYTETSQLRRAREQMRGLEIAGRLVRVAWDSEAGVGEVSA